MEVTRVVVVNDDGSAEATYRFPPDASMSFQSWGIVIHCKEGTPIPGYPHKLVIASRNVWLEIYDEEYEDNGG